MPRILAPVLALLLVAACGGGGSSGSAAPAETPTSTTMSAAATSTTAATTAVEVTPDTTTTSVAATGTTAATTAVEVARDLVYRSGDPHPAKLDVYYSIGTGDGPVIVFFHGGGVTKSYRLYSRVVEALAARGAVVFVPDWEAGFSGRPEELSAFYDGAGCAAAYALVHASGYGGDPGRLVLAGHSAGATPASILGVRAAAPVPDCSVDLVSFRPAGMLLWDGDLMLGGPSWDRYGEALPGLMEVSTLWPLLAEAPRTPTVMVTGELARDEWKRCGAADPTTPFWVRDPDGWFHEQLTAIGALEDGCVDIGEAADLLTASMQEHGFEATHLILEGSGHVGLSDEDLDLLVNEIISLADVAG